MATTIDTNPASSPRKDVVIPDDVKVSGDVPYYRYLSPVTIDLFWGVHSSFGGAQFDVASQKGLQRFKSEPLSNMSLGVDLELFSLAGVGVRFFVGGVMGMANNDIGTDFQYGDSIYSSRVHGDYSDVTLDIFAKTPPIVLAPNHLLQFYYLCNLGQEYKDIEFVGGILNSGTSDYDVVEEESVLGKINFQNHMFGISYRYKHPNPDFLSIGLDLFAMYTRHEFVPSKSGHSVDVEYPSWSFGLSLVVGVRPLDFLFTQ